MASIHSAATIAAQLAAWEAASLALANNESYSINGRTLTRADMADVERALTYWGRQQRLNSRGGIRVTGAEIA